MNHTRRDLENGDFEMIDADRQKALNALTQLERALMEVFKEIKKDKPYVIQEIEIIRDTLSEAPPALNAETVEVGDLVSFAIPFEENIVGIVRYSGEVLSVDGYHLPKTGVRIIEKGKRDE